MADSLLDLTWNNTIFLYGHDWKSDITEMIDMKRSVIQYPGSHLNIRNITNDIPLSVTMQFTNMSKADEYNLTSFFCARKGRIERFWLPVWESLYTLNADIVAGSNLVTVLMEDHYTFHRGYERFFMLLSDGSLLTRNILDFNGDPGHNIMTILSPMDRNVSVSEVVAFGKLILCRFDQDELSFKYANRNVSECSISFLELPKEYTKTGGMS